MKKLILIVFIASFSNVLSQKSLLDEKFGFKDIKLNSNISEFENLYNVHINNKVEIYEYQPIKEKLYFIFNEKFNRILMVFDHNTKALIGIRLIKNFDEYNFGCEKQLLESTKYLESNFEKVLGKFDYYQNNDNGFGAIWESDKVYLGIESSLKFKDLDNEYRPIGKCQISVSFYLRSDGKELRNGF